MIPGPITLRHAAKRERRRQRSLPRLRLIDGRWCAVPPEGGDRRTIDALLVHAIRWCDRQNAKRGLPPRVLFPDPRQ